MFEFIDVEKIIDGVQVQKEFDFGTNIDLNSLQQHQISYHPYACLYSSEFHSAYFDYEIQPTIYFYEMMAYYYRASALQGRNLGLIHPSYVDIVCPLQREVHIYDTVSRWYAGFSNAPQEVFLGENNPKHQWNVDHGFSYPGLRDKFNTYTWMYLFLVHRVTGSGASFALPGDKLPPHGWYNTPLPYLASSCENLNEMRDWIKNTNKPIFTSVGNQIPPFSKPTSTNYSQGGKQYICEIAPQITYEFYKYLVNQNEAVGIQSAVDKILEIQSSFGEKKFKFVLTAWVMDIAEYFPHLIDPNSDCYHGKNAIESIDLIFHDRAKRRSKQEFYDTATRFFADQFNSRPMDVEDVFCDFIRWTENYIQQKGYSHLDKDSIFHHCYVKHDKGRQRTN